MKVLFCNNGLKYGDIYSDYINEHNVINAQGVQESLREAAKHNPDVLVVSSDCALSVIEQLESNSLVIVIARHTIPSTEVITAYKVLYHHHDGRPPEPHEFKAVIDQIQQKLVATR